MEISAVTMILEQNGARFPLRLPPVSHETFVAFCQRNPDLQAERTADGEIRIQGPRDAWTDSRNVQITAELWNWNESLSRAGYVFGQSAGFTLLDSSILSPDASWIAKARWDSLPDSARSYIAPDFVAELTSPSDSLKEARAKMDDYLRNGVRLGWLIHRCNRVAYVYRPGQEVETLDDPALLTGDPELPGFVRDMSRVF